VWRADGSVANANGGDARTGQPAASHPLAFRAADGGGDGVFVSGLCGSFLPAKLGSVGPVGSV